MNGYKNIFIMAGGLGIIMCSSYLTVVKPLKVVLRRLTALNYSVVVRNEDVSKQTNNVLETLKDLAKTIPRQEPAS